MADQTTTKRKPRRLHQYTNDLLVVYLSITYAIFTYLGISDLAFTAAFLTAIGYAFGRKIPISKLKAA